MIVDVEHLKDWKIDLVQVIGFKDLRLTKVENLMACGWDTAFKCKT